MAVLNLVLRGHSVDAFTRRISCDLTQMAIEDKALWSLCVMDCFADYIYCLNQVDLDTVKAWLTAKEYTFGTDEDIAPTAEVQTWLDQEEVSLGGTQSKSTIYDKLKLVFPTQECIDARA